jgi:N-acetylmuramoyl-L-alanine amidase
MPIPILTPGSNAKKPKVPAVEKPHIVWKPIPFGAKRKAQMAAYSLRHYGQKTWVLSHPHVIIEHYTAGPTFASAWNTFADNAPNLGEEPGVCAQFIIDTDGTIYQLVPLNVRCRHAVGMNYTAIGIEHVAMTQGQVMHDAAQMRSSFLLTLWLMSRYHIQLRNVIGHAEALMSPYHHELIASWRCQVHGDWPHADMIWYRAKLKKLVLKHYLPVGPPPRWVNPHC